MAPYYCKTCGKLGHTSTTCKKNIPKITVVGCTKDSKLTKGDPIKHVVETVTEDSHVSLVQEPLPLPKAPVSSAFELGDTSGPLVKGIGSVKEKDETISEDGGV
ncbi:uncharacterized protein LOC141605732 [Silene latifolia]|uniref:uncharacterized protein LOC141605732 n=1 Tax=Silene latifolia TaxID=37657 RepID=UPI003D76ABA5